MVIGEWWIVNYSPNPHVSQSPSPPIPMSPTVSLIRATSYEAAALRVLIESVLAPLGGMAAFVKPGNRVLLKPNLLTGARPTKECVTRQELVRCVAELVIEAGGKPFFGDSPAFGSAMGVAKSNGYLPMMAELDLPVVEFHGKRYETASTEFNHQIGRASCRERV